MLRCVLLIACVGLALVATPLSAKDLDRPSVPVFVTSSGAVDGFTDPNKDNRDTMNDLRQSLKGRKRLEVVDHRDAAVIVLTVLGRDRALSMPMGFGIVGRDVVVKVRFQYRDVDTEMSASALGGTVGSGGAWRTAASKIASQVDEWIKVNRDKL
jgi:hypothetical protein